MLSKYANRIADARKQLSQLRALAKEAGETGLEVRIGAAEQRLGRRRFQIAVVGEFKAGKSTLINALICEDVLPVAARECTAVICRIRATQENEAHGATLFLANGSTQEVTPEEAREHLTVASAKYHGVPVEEAEFRLSGAAWLGPDVELVDTPGVNASGQAREKATLSYLPKADAIVFLTRADELLTKSEVAFLQDRVIRNDLARAFIVINFADRLKTERDFDDVRGRAQKVLAPLMESPRLFLLSARNAREALQNDEIAELNTSGVPAFQTELQRFIENERAEVEVRRLDEVLQAFARELQAALSQRFEAMTFDRDTARRRRGRLEELVKLARAEGRAAEEEAESALSAFRLHSLPLHVKSAGERLSSALDSLNAGSKTVREADALGVADNVGGAAISAIQGALRDQTTRVHQQAAARLSAMFGKCDAQLGGDTSISVRPMDYGAMIQIYSTQIEEKERVEEKPSASAAEVAASAVAGAAVGAIIGGLIFGPIGYYLGAALGGAAGSESTIKRESVFKTVSKWVVHSKVNKDDTVRRFSQSLESGALDAIEMIRRRTVADIGSIVASKVAELQRRMDECDHLEAGSLKVDTKHLGTLVARAEVLSQAAANTVADPANVLPKASGQITSGKQLEG